MSEINRSGFIEAADLFSARITEEDVVRDPLLLDRYRRQAVIDIRNGDSVWLRRDFNANDAVVMDFFNSQEHQGFLLDRPGVGYDVYALNEPNALNPEALPLDAAKAALESFVNRK